jgi:carbon-monoxide dehydrogenase small subunit
MEQVEVAVTVNRTRYARAVEPRRLLSDFIRHDLGLTGTHVGCEHGVCGMCTVLIDGHTARACLTFAVQATAPRSRPSRGWGHRRECTRSNGPSGRSTGCSVTAGEGEVDAAGRGK